MEYNILLLYNRFNKKSKQIGGMKMNEEGTKVAGSSLGSLSMRERLAYGAGSMGTFMASTIISGCLMFFYSD